MNLERLPFVELARPAWLRYWSVLTMVSAFLAVLVGTLVTTFHVGMADPLWPTAPWHLLVKESVPSFGYYVEHTHRIVGYLIGVCAIVLAIGTWWRCPSPLRRGLAIACIVAVSATFGAGQWFVRNQSGRTPDVLLNPAFAATLTFSLGLIALSIAELQSNRLGRWSQFAATALYLGVVSQGAIGGLRVYLNEWVGPNLAIVHGIFAQALVAVSAVVCLMHSASWRTLLDADVAKSTRWLALAMLGLTFTQIVFGGFVRHFDDVAIARRLHPFLAFAILMIAIWLTARAELPSLRRHATAIVAMVLVQAALGIETWLRTSGTTRVETVRFADAVVRSMHVVVGFGVFAAVALLAARAWKARLI